MAFWLILAIALGIAGFLNLRARIVELERKISLRPEKASTEQSIATTPFRPIANDIAQSVPTTPDASGTAPPDETTEEPSQEETIGENASSSSDEKAAEPETFAEPMRKLATASKSETFEQAIGTKWIVWLGGLMFALGGIFLVRYAANEGYFGPGVRIFMGSVMSISLLAFGERLRRSPIMSDIINLPNIAIPPIVTAVGIIVAFATAYSAYALYDMLSPGAVFILLALISIASVLLAAVHGPLLGAFGILGSYATPAMVSSDEPSSILLFTYLTFVTLAILSLIRLRAWWGLGIFALVGVVLWTLIGIFTLSQPETTDVLSIYLPLMALLFSFAPTHQVAEGEVGPGLSRVLTVGSIVALGGLLALLIFKENYPNIGLLSLGAFALIGIVVCYRNEFMEHEFILSTCIVVLSLLAWVPTQPLAFEETDAASRGALSPPSLPVELTFYTNSLALFGGAYAVICFWLLPKVQNRGLWASVSATVPIILLAVVYWRSTALDTSMAWGFVAGVVALIATFATLSSRTEARGSDGVVGAYATAALAALALGLSMVLRDAWLTASLSLLLVGLVWVNASLALPLLRWISLIVAGIVTWRLTLNPSLVLYEISTTPIFNLLIYAYALPAGAMALAAVWMRRQKDDIIVECLEAGAVLLLTLFISFEIHHWISGGDMFSQKFEFGERSVQTLTWLALSYLYYRLGQRTDRIILIYAGRVLRWLGLAHLLFVQLLVGNPLVTGAFVGSLFFFNLLVLAYLAPAAFTALYYLSAKKRNDRPTALVFGASTLVLGLTFVTLQIRQIFHGGVLNLGPATDMEWYSYSIVWLTTGIALFGISFVRGGRDLRIAAMLVITFAAAKGFLFDMSELTGILRAISFIGFGAALIGIGLLYQRFIFPPKRTPPNTETP